MTQPLRINIIEIYNIRYNNVTRKPVLPTKKYPALALRTEKNQTTNDPNKATR